MVEYPDNFETPAFPAGKRIAVSRIMSIGALTTFLLCIFLCGLLFWATRSMRVDPFLIYINTTDGEWTIVGHDHNGKSVSAQRTLQESVVGNFVKNWFTISGDTAANDAMWCSGERRTTCSVDLPGAHGGMECRLYCACADDVFSTFTTNVLPEYEMRADAGERRGLITDTLQISPVGQISDRGGVWRVQATIQSSTSGDFEIIAYVRVAVNTELYPRTLGYFVTDFNAYKL